MYASPAKRSPFKGGPRDVPEGPIQDFCTVIESTPQEEWQTRTTALKTLVSLVPDRTLSGSPSKSPHATTAWYNSPPTLRHLAIPFSELLKDARSTVVKRTCEYLTDFVHKCQYDARYLIKDIMPTIMGVHAQTVQVIRNYVQSMTLQAIAVVPCKMAMPLWLDRLKSDKSRTVREACALYLGTALLEWSTRDENYLSKDIWTQVASSLVQALRDPAPAARQNAKRGLETVQGRRPDVMEKLIEDAKEMRDTRVLKTLTRIRAGERTSDDMSVGSNSRIGSVASASSRRSARKYAGVTSPTAAYIQGRTTLSAASPSTSRARLQQQQLQQASSYSRFPEDLPTDIAVMGGNFAKSPSHRTMGAPSPSAANGSNHSRGGMNLGRRAFSERGYRTNGMPPPASRSNSALGPPVRLTVGTTAGIANLRGDDIVPSASFDTVESLENDKMEESSAIAALRIANKSDLQEHAKKRNSRRSSLLKMRLANSRSKLVDSGNESSSNVDNSETLLDDLLEQDRLEKKESEPLVAKNSVDQITDAMDSVHIANGSTSNGVRKRQEHEVIALELLEAHKAHVDTIMATLKIEMDALKDFETVLLHSNAKPTEDEVLNYFESVGLCLDQRTTAGNILRRSMDRISQGGGGINGNNQNGSIRPDR